MSGPVFETAFDVAFPGLALGDGAFFVEALLVEALADDGRPGALRPACMIQPLSCGALANDARLLSNRAARRKVARSSRIRAVT
ncbi:hypothetical protein AUC69_06275 [Methyloceanibacter superfactus]|uniref:Uncharacterized protein n=1 Tax=Methyloceanibacter superfactus TaxID=1774969 RepID=A0A1E3W710_9HYPH|nr:hypothetical protein AUC69_06275 [Methyloceanibacter superfactus]